MGVGRPLLTFAQRGRQTVLWLIGYCDKYNIPLRREQQLRDYVKLSKVIMTEISQASSDVESLVKRQKSVSDASDEFLQHKKPDKDFTEP